MEYKSNKWNYEEGGGGGRFQTRKVRVALLNGDEIERKWRGILVWSKWHHCWCSGDMEGVAILLKDEWHSAVIDFGCVSSRILRIKFRFSKIKVCVVVGYGPSEGGGEERDRFFSGMDSIPDRVGIV